MLPSLPLWIANGGRQCKLTALQLGNGWIYVDAMIKIVGVRVVFLVYNKVLDNEQDKWLILSKKYRNHL
jgi:hypothetical protein